MGAQWLMNRESAREPAGYLHSQVTMEGSPMSCVHMTGRKAVTIEDHAAGSSGGALCLPYQRLFMQTSHP